MTTKIKRIISSLLCVIMLQGAVAVAADTAESPTARQYGEYETDEPGPRYDPRGGVEVYAGFTPDYKKKYDSYQYGLFKDIMKLYTESHLYEFTEEQVTEAFLMKLLRENPALMKLYIDTLLGTMDEYSAYYEAGMGLAGDGSGLAYGLGISSEGHYVIRNMGLTEKGIYITDVTEGSNAELASIRVGDKILSVEGISVSALTYDAATTLVRYLPYVEDEVFDENGVSLGIPNEPEHIVDEVTGKKSYILHMTLERPDGTQYEAKLTKSRIVPSNIGVTIPEGKSYAYISIDSFIGDKIVEDFDKALAEVESNNRDNLIIDLRDNTGGSLDKAIGMANLLIAEEGRTLFYLNSRDEENLTVVKSLGGGRTFEKITVMVNGGSASASELFAMILNFQCGATLVGSTTYGKAVGQSSFTFVGGDMFTITTMEVLDPLKKSYHKKGLVPDVEVFPGLRKFEFPEGLEVFNYVNYKELSEGVESETALGLEKRLVLLGILRDEYADGVYDAATTAAIKVLRTGAHKSPEATLDDDDVANITNLINGLKNRYYFNDDELEVAEMTFSSRSQAKRRAKELAKIDEQVSAQKAKEEKEFLEQAKREE